jgi:hypothetical protein
MLEEAERAAISFEAGPASPLVQSIARLRRALEAFEAGRPLLHGECPEDLPEALRRLEARGADLSSPERSCG